MSNLNLTRMISLSLALIILKLFRLVVLVEASGSFGIGKLFLLLLLLLFPKPLLLRFAMFGGMAWLLTAVYASPYNTVRSTLWDHLVSISIMHKLPWIILGDFNEILFMNEKKGGSLIMVELVVSKDGFTIQL